jgi:hypothetical protein
METLTIEQITVLQKQYGLTELQERIESGLCWKLEGSYGRAASDALESGACFLPDVIRIDYYGNRVPARSMLKAGTKGTLENSQRFWQAVEDGEIQLVSNDDEGEEQ